MATNVTDIELIRRVLHEEDSRAFGVLMQRYSGHVLGAALRLMKDEDDAAEVTQLAFIQAYKQLHQWRGENFQAWVTIIANHIALRMLEKEKRRQTVPLEDHYDAPDERYDEQKEQRLQSLEKAIEQLPEGDSEIVRLHYYEGVSLGDIARKLGQTENNVKVRLFRIRDKLKTLINNGNDN